MSGPLLLARFDPTHTQLALAVQALDTHQVKVQALVVAQDLLNTLFLLKKAQKVSVLEWVSPSQLAVGLTSGAVLVYAPSSNSILGEIQCPSNLAISDIHYSTITHTAWMADTEGNVYEWDTQLVTLLQSFALADMLDAVEAVSKIATIVHHNEVHLLLGTHNVYVVDVLGKCVVQTFPAHVQPIISILPVHTDPDLFLTAAEGDRFINVYSLKRNAPKSVLVAPSAVTLVSLGMHAGLSVVVAITETGTLELFNNPLSGERHVQDPTSKRRRKQLAASVQSRHSDASVVYARPTNEIRAPDDERLAVNAVAASENVVHITWAESGGVSRFDTLPWHTDGGVSISGLQTIRRSKQQFTPTSHSDAGHDIAAPRPYSERHTVVTEGAAFQDDLVNSDENDDDDDETLAEKMEKLTGSQRQTAKDKKKLQKHTAGTLTVVLSQALRNNDHSLLETVLANRDPGVVQNTISRLDPALAVMLLDRLAERITRKQQHVEQMNFWLRWIIIVHGGVLASMPTLHNRLASLHTVLSKNASTLPRLFELQGRLNLIEHQTSLKREILDGTVSQNNCDDADTDVEYVEEIDDANEAGIIGSGDDESDDDTDMDAADDYEDGNDEEAKEERWGVHYDDGEGLSDVETAVVNNDVYDDDD